MPASQQYIRLGVNNPSGRCSQLSQHSEAFTSISKPVMLQPLPGSCGPALHDVLKISLLIDGLIVAKGKHAINYPPSQLPRLAAEELMAYQEWGCDSGNGRGLMWQMFEDIAPADLQQWLTEDIATYKSLLDTKLYVCFGKGVATVEGIVRPELQDTAGSSSVAAELPATLPPAVSPPAVSPPAEPVTPELQSRVPAAQAAPGEAQLNAAGITERTLDAATSCSDTDTGQDRLVAPWPSRPASRSFAAGLPAGPRTRWPQQAPRQPAQLALLRSHSMPGQRQSVVVRAHSTAAPGNLAGPATPPPPSDTRTASPQPAQYGSTEQEPAAAGTDASASSSARAGLTDAACDSEVGTAYAVPSAACEGRTVQSLRPIVRPDTQQAVGRQLRQEPRAGRYRLYRERDLTASHAHLLYGFSKWIDVTLCHSSLDQRAQAMRQMKQQVTMLPGVYEFAAWRPVSPGSKQCYLVPIYLGKAGAHLPTSHTDQDSNAHLRQRFSRYLNAQKGRIEPDWRTREERRALGRGHADAADGKLHDKNDVFKECQLRGFGVAYRFCVCHAPLEPLWLESWLLAQVDYAANRDNNGGYRGSVADIFVSDTPGARTLADFPRLPREARLPAAVALEDARFVTASRQPGDVILAGSHL